MKQSIFFLIQANCDNISDVLGDADTINNLFSNEVE